MKKIYFAGFAALMMGLASCSSSEPQAPVADGEEVTVTVTATLPASIQSRSFSDGLKALDLYYAVYEEGNTTEPIIELTKSPKQFNNLENTLTLNLVTGKTYNVVFWAQSPDAEEIYTLDKVNSTVTINYEKIDKVNVEETDAFFCFLPVEVKESTTVSAKLKRPLAQINVGTNDMAYGGLSKKDIYAAMTVKKAYKQFSLQDGEIIGDATQVVLNKDIRPNDGVDVADDEYQAFPVGDKGVYEYMCMAYVLVNEKIATDVVLSFYDGDVADPFHTVNVYSAPLQRNYRTNIYGSLLTSTLDFSIIILPGYEDPDYTADWQ